MLWKYIHHLVMESQTDSRDALSILLPENSCKITWKEFMTWRLNNSTLSYGIMSPVGYRGPPTPDSNPNVQPTELEEEHQRRSIIQFSRMRNTLKPSKEPSSDCHNI